MVKTADVIGLFQANSRTIGAGVGGATIGLGVGYLAGRRSSRKKSKRRKKSASRVVRKRNHRNKSRRTRYTPHTAGKRKDKSHKRIRYTKKGQPYIIKANGRAQFIKKKSAKSSYKRKGGRY